MNLNFYITVYVVWSSAHWERRCSTNCFLIRAKERRKAEDWQTLNVFGIKLIEAPALYMNAGSPAVCHWLDTVFVAIRQHRSMWLLFWRCGVESKRSEPNSRCRLYFYEQCMIQINKTRYTHTRHTVTLLHAFYLKQHKTETIIL